MMHTMNLGKLEYQIKHKMVFMQYIIDAIFVHHRMHDFIELESHLIILIDASMHMTYLCLCVCIFGQRQSQQKATNISKPSFFQIHKLIHHPGKGVVATFL